LIRQSNRIRKRADLPYLLLARKLPPEQAQCRPDKLQKMAALPGRSGSTGSKPAAGRPIHPL